MTETRAQIEHERARHANGAAHARRQLAYWYEQNRLLENRVRKANAMPTDADKVKALTIIARTVPINARAKWAIGVFTRKGTRR